MSVIWSTYLFYLSSSFLDKYGFYDSFDEDTGPKVRGEDVIMYSEGNGGSDGEQLPLEVCFILKFTTCCIKGAPGFAIS